MSPRVGWFIVSGMRQTCFDSGLEVVLRLDDELLKVRRLELVALGLVEEDVRHLESGVEVVGGEAKAGLGVANRNVRARNDNELLELLELDVERDAVVRERRKRQRRPRRKREPERQRNVEVARLAAVADQLRAGVATARESVRRRPDLPDSPPHEHEGTPQAVDLLTADDELGLVDKEVANVVAIVRPNIAKLTARDIRAVGVALNAATELTRRTVLLTAPDILRLLEGLRLLVLRQRRVVAREVLRGARPRPSWRTGRNRRRRPCTPGTGRPGRCRRRPRSWCRTRQCPGV